MAIRSEDLEGWDGDAAVLEFPVAFARRRAEVQRRVLVARRRAGVAAIVLLVVIGALLGGGTGNTAPVAREGAPKKVVIQEGQTLWDVASRYAPEGVDTRAFVDAIIRLNGLEGAPQEGAKIRLPR